MDLDRLYKILDDATCELRKGDVFEGTDALLEQAKQGAELNVGGVLHVYAMPPLSGADPEDILVDVEFIVIGVNPQIAERYRDEFLRILREYPEPSRLAGGPSYIEVGAEVGSQSGALRLFALGKALGLWEVITPSTMGFAGVEAREMAGRGFVMITGFRG